MTSSYDEMPYVHTAFPQSHPDRLLTLGRLFGLSPPAIERCRVLELGCAAGDNLIPMALGLPQARFLGIDLSERQIHDGQALIARLGLDNIELRQADIGSFDKTDGVFDYIICHGVYSWVADTTRAKILSICSDNLADDGVAYVSYNTLPGWRIRGMVREMMVYHAEQFADAPTKVQQARSLLGFLARSATPQTPYAVALKAELDSIDGKEDAYLFHDHLEQVNEAVYFRQFVEAARQHGLQYLGEASFRDMVVSNFAPEVAETLRRIAPDIVRLEQYMDFVRNRTFRQTLLVHDGLAIKRRLDRRPVEHFYIAGATRPSSEKPLLAQGEPESFRTADGATFTTCDAITKAALLLLVEQWPRSIAFSDLLAAARAKLQADAAQADAAAGLPIAPTAQDIETLAVTMVQCFGAGVVELHAWSPVLAAVPSAKPQASALARIQAEGGVHVTNLRHEPTTIDPLQREVLVLLDGSRDVEALVRELTAMAQRGALQLRHPQSGESLTSGPQLEIVLRQALNECLSTLARLGVLIE